MAHNLFVKRVSLHEINWGYYNLGTVIEGSINGQHFRGRLLKTNKAADIKVKQIDAPTEAVTTKKPTKLWICQDVAENDPAVPTRLGYKCALNIGDGNDKTIASNGLVIHRLYKVKNYKIPAEYSGLEINGHKPRIRKRNIMIDKFTISRDDLKKLYDAVFAEKK